MPNASPGRPLTCHNKGASISQDDSISQNRVRKSRTPFAKYSSRECRPGAPRPLAGGARSPGRARADPPGLGGVGHRRGRPAGRPERGHRPGLGRDHPRRGRPDHHRGGGRPDSRGVPARPRMASPTWPRFPGTGPEEFVRAAEDLAGAPAARLAGDGHPAFARDASGDLIGLRLALSGPEQEELRDLGADAAAALRGRARRLGARRARPGCAGAGGGLTRRTRRGRAGPDRRRRRPGAPLPPPDGGRCASARAGHGGGGGAARPACTPPPPGSPARARCRRTCARCGPGWAGSSGTCWRRAGRRAATGRR